MYLRYEIIGALINGTILLTSCFIMGLEAIQRMAFEHEEIGNIDLVLIVGGLGLAINLIGLFIFGHHGHSHSHHGHHGHHGHGEEEKEKEQQQDHGQESQHQHDHENLNIRGVFLHILGDLLGSVAVMNSALIIKYTDGWWTTYIDPTCTLLIVLIISFSAWPLVQQSANMLLGKSPFIPSILSEMEEALRSIPGVLNVHELYCWEVKTGYVMATVHFIVDPNWEDDGHSAEYCRDECDVLHDKMTIMDRGKQILHRFGIHSSIVQTEYPGNGDLDWKQGDVSCFDYVCEQTECIEKGKTLSNEVFKKRVNTMSSVNDPNNANVQTTNISV